MAALQGSPACAARCSPQRLTFSRRALDQKRNSEKEGVCEMSEARTLT